MRIVSSRSRVLLVLAAAGLAPAVARSQPLTENFDSVALLAGSGWVATNNSSPAGSTGWFQGNTAAFPSQGGAANSYVAANLNGATFGGNISNWLITPTLTDLRNTTVLTFYTRTETSAPAPDRLEVRLSTNGSSTNVGATDASVGDFTTLLLSVNPALTPGGYPGTWTLFTVALSGLPAGPNTGRIAFRHFVPNTGSSADVVGIDTLNVVTGVCPPPPPLVMNVPSEVGTGSPNRVASVNAIFGATYAWTIGNGTITSGQGTNEITFTAGAAGVPLTLNVTAAAGGCPSGGAFATVTVLPVGSAIQFYPLAPCRIVDTRGPGGPVGGPALAPGPDRIFTLAGACGIPAGASAVSANVTVTGPGAPGNLAIYRGDGTLPPTSTLNFGPGQTRANNATLQLALDGSGTVRVHDGSTGSVHLVLDVNGYFQ
jgi:hypothetical protein